VLGKDVYHLDCSCEKGRIIKKSQGQKDTLRTINTSRKKANWIGHFLRRNCLLEHVIEGKVEGRIEMTGRRGR